MPDEPIPAPRRPVSGTRALRPSLILACIVLALTGGIWVLAFTAGHVSSLYDVFRGAGLSSGVSIGLVALVSALIPLLMAGALVALRRRPRSR